MLQSGLISLIHTDKTFQDISWLQGLTIPEQMRRVNLICVLEEVVDLA